MQPEKYIPVELIDVQFVALKYTVVMPLQFWKAYPPIAVTEFGMVVDVNPVQPLKAYRPIEMTEFGIVMDVIPLQSLNAYSGIFVTLLPIFSVVKEVHPPKQSPSLIFVQLVALKFTVRKLVHP